MYGKENRYAEAVFLAPDDVMTELKVDSFPQVTIQNLVTEGYLKDEYKACPDGRAITISQNGDVEVSDS